MQSKEQPTEMLTSAGTTVYGETTLIIPPMRRRSLGAGLVCLIKGEQEMTPDNNETEE